MVANRESRERALTEREEIESSNAGAMTCKGVMILLGSGLHAITHGDDGQTNAVGNRTISVTTSALE